MLTKGNFNYNCETVINKRLKWPVNNSDNSIFGALCSALAVFFSIFLGISTSLYIAAGCYALVTLCTASLTRERNMPRERPDSAVSSVSV